MPGSENEVRLIEAVQRGEADAWRDLIDRYQGRLVSFAKRMLAQPGDAEDLVQDTFMGLLRSLPTFDPDRSLETYLFAILRHKLNDHFRRQKTGQRQSLEQLDLDDTPTAWIEPDTPSSHLAGAESLAAQRAALVRCLRQWVEQCEVQGRFQELIVVEMLMVVGLRNREVAADLGLSETAVAGVKFRVIERWRELTREQIRDHDWQEADLAATSTVARIWREEGVSCPKRSTLGRFLLGALDDDWNSFVEFHSKAAGCDRCLANLDDLRSEDERDARSHEQLRERCFASSVGFLSRRPE
ncbi:MAG: sigma-70 family RNA polymerase sigma factor [Planctomycetes bacterium]|nr:sigma-70 family RNA polymerase sigma factor [Planctomycetota bacterium]